MSIHSIQPFRVDDVSETHRLIGGGLVRTLVADVLIASDLPVDRTIRAGAGALLVPSGCGAVGFASAAWVLTGWWPGPEPPARLELVVPPGRTRPPAGRALRIRQVPLAGTDVMVLGTLAVTTPVRTAVDVARDLPAFQALAALRALRRETEVLPEQALARLAGLPSARGVVRARRVLTGWAVER